MTSKAIFVDSSVLIEGEKGNRPELILALTQRPGLPLFISSVVVSEYLFHFLAMHTKVSPRTVKERGQIGVVLQGNSNYKAFTQFELVDVAPKDLSSVASLMADYNLLPNDALIVATCLSRDIGGLASFDPDFSDVCAAKGLALIDSPEALDGFLMNLTKS